MGISPFGGFGDVMFTVVPIIIAVGFFFVFGTIIVRAIQGTKQWKTNNDSPVLTVDATVVARRADVHQYSTHNRKNHLHTTTLGTTYYATFEVDSGDRMEFKVRDNEYGLLAEKDRGKLTFQGTRFLGFERI